MTIKLARLLEEIRPLEVIGETDKNIIGVHSDSRKVEKDTLFVAVRGVTTFETGTGFSSIVTDIPGISGGSVNVFVGAAERTNYQPGNENPVYYALEALAVNAIESEETADFEDINIPIE